MGRDFTKTATAGYGIGLGSAAIGARLAGRARATFHAWINYSSVSAGASDNRIIGTLIAGTGTNGLTLNLDGSVSPPRLRAAARSLSTDALQAAVGATPLVAGVWYSVACVFDFENDRITLYVDGVQDATAAVAFANTVYTNGSPTQGDVIGNAHSGQASAATAFGGRIAEVGVWDYDLGAAALAELGAGRSATDLANAAAPVLYWPLTGQYSELDVIGGRVGTLTGSVPATDHPPMVSGSVPVYWYAPSDSGAPAQTLSPASIASGQTFGSATLARGAVGIAPTSIDSGQGFGLPTLARGAVAVSPTGIAAGSAFGSPLLGRGAVNLAPSGINAALAFGAFAVGRGAVSVRPAAIPASEAFGGLSLAPGGVVVSPPSITTGVGFGTPVVLAGGSLIIGAGVASREAVGAPVLARGAVQIRPTGVASTEAAGTPAIIPPPWEIAPVGIASAEAPGASTVSAAAVAVVLQGVPASTAFGIAAITRGLPVVVWAPSPRFTQLDTSARFVTQLPRTSMLVETTLATEFKFEEEIRADF